MTEPDPIDPTDPAGPGGPTDAVGDDPIGADRSEARQPRAPQVDEISEIEAEAEAQVPGPGPAHPHHSDRAPGPERGPDLDADRRPERGTGSAAGAAAGPDAAGSGPAPNGRLGRQRFLVIYLRVALLVALVAGVVELVVPDHHRDRAGDVMVALLVVAPLGRVVWLMVRWQRRGDWRFALVGLVLLAVVATGLVAR